ncbi:type I methionyl aminopeptidase [Jatrophihabitans telluris]|uniref:Methionine aminopeptidase n=1 Tax=Jatrophihabitans telluris TaxID=2038343 RepID=A0ABY4QWJ0_9ACTN|nr:type I methionyl aminopeptidase [Jatrophihabitans telluris]UQX87986.1 type I methionyl aminopeptidase [Jatrophihabitans telluris]
MRRRQPSIEIKSINEIRLMRAAGLVVAEGLAAMAAAAVPGASTADLDRVGREVIDRHGAVSSFLGYAYPPFPAVICSSRNAAVVHGIPSAADVLNEGDLISIDYGAILAGWHGDAAVSVGVGTSVDPKVAELSEACRKALWDGIAAAAVGRRLSDISAAVESSVRHSGSYGIVENYGGHGIGTSMHMEPHLLNYGKPGRGPDLVPGMCLAVEPMITLGSASTRELDDDWTVVTVDGSWAAHWEHTIALLPDGVWVLTAEDGGRAELESRGVRVSAVAD